MLHGGDVRNVYSVAMLIQLAQIAALGSHPYILEDGPELPKTSESHADPGGEVLEGMYTEGCISIEEARIRGSSGGAGGLGTVSGT
jgi:hypothetical protein